MFKGGGVDVYPKHNLNVKSLLTEWVMGQIQSIMLR